MDRDIQQLTVGGHALELRVSAASDVGSVRIVNEDSYLASVPVFLVADGMGGHAHGDRASREIADIFATNLGGAEAATTAGVLATISSANSAVRRLSPAGASDSAVAGSTLTGVAIVEVDGVGSLGWMIFNIGDSRVYSWHADRLSQLTTDHSAVQELVDLGEISPREAELHPERNVVTRAIGVDPVVEPDVWLIPVGGRQVFLACSDGLTKELSDATIAGIMRTCDAQDDFESVAGLLIAAAIDAGGADNITVVVVETRWGDGPTDAGSASRMPAFLEETVPRG